jgi:hypothetical protein
MEARPGRRGFMSLLGVSVCCCSLLCAHVGEGLYWELSHLKSPPV